MKQIIEDAGAEMESEALLSSPSEMETGAFPSSPSEMDEEGLKRSLIDTLPDGAVEELCTLFGCTREALGGILSATSGDPTHIISLVQALSPAYIAVKLRFETRKRGELGGASCIIAKGSSGDLLDQTLWIGSKALPDTFSIDADWEAVRNGIQKIGQNPDRSLFPKILKILRDAFSPTAVNTLYTSQSGSEKIILALEKAFASLYHNEVVIEMKIEKFNKARLEIAGLGEAKEPVVAEKTTEPPFVIGSIATVQIQCKPLLDPVKGKPVSELVPGDLLVVEIEKTGGIAGIVTKILAHSGESPIFPVISVEKLPSGQSLIKLSVSKGIEGIAKVSADLRLKTAPAFFFGGTKEENRSIAKKIFWGFLFFFGSIMILYWIFRG